MLHAAPPLEVGGSRSAHNRCLLRDVGGHGALPADFSVYGEDAATTRFLLERILRGSGIAPLPSPASSSADFNPAEGQHATEAPSGSPTTEQGRGEDIPEDSGTGAPTTADLHNPLEATAPAAVSRLTGILVPGARIIIVSNRLPVTAKRVGEDWKLDESSGGLVSALRGVTGLELMWVGWPGVSVPGKEDQAIVTHKLLHERCTPVFLSEDLMDQYYSGYCNNILWPVFHYMGLPQSQKFNMVKDFDSQLKAYEEANQMFADVVCKIHKEGDTVWIHDYHLMLLPMLLKKSNINMKVGWFLHTPFPSPEVYRALPNRMELLESVLNAELVGFQTYDYARNFVRACSSLLGLETYLEGVEFKGRIVKVEAFPIGIDSARFKNALELPEVQTKIAEFKQLFSGRKVLLGVDRFDMIKGLPQKVLAFEKFLEENEDLREKVVLLQIAVPTRSDVPEYQKLASQVHELVARVNGEFGTLKTTPIQHLDQTVNFSMLCALYAVTDVALVTSLRDGMNLVSYEYVACQESKKGVLILSEFAGAAQSLGAGAIIVNPWNITDVAKSIKCALEMPAHEREKRHRDNYELVSAHSAQDWAEDFILELLDTANKAPLQTKEPVALPLKETVSQFAQSRSRLLMFGFNETLTGQVQSFESATDQTANKLKLNPELKGYLKTLCDNEKTTVIVVSGYGKVVLDENFREFNMWLAAENGIFIRKSGEEWMVTTSDHLESGCSDSVKNVIGYFTKRTPKSYLEQCEKSFVWNYKYADDDFGANQAKEMLHHLGAYSSSNRSAVIIQGRRTIEVRPVGVTKGSTFTGILEELGCSKNVNTPIDYILCIGHFLAEDEDLYTLLNGAIKPESKRKAKGWQADCLSVKDENYFSCTVGREHSVAQYKLEGTSDVVSLLHDLADTDVAH